MTVGKLVTIGRPLPSVPFAAAPNFAADNSLPGDDVQARSLALLVNADGQDQPPGATNFLREDSYWWDSSQTIGGQSRAWSPIATGIEDGAPGDDLMTMTATLGSLGQNTPQGIAKLIYVVTTGDLEIRGTIARTSDPGNATDTGGGVPGAGYMLYDYETQTLTYTIVPEPSTWVLITLAVAVISLKRIFRHVRE
ncbi:MAG: PEP-CTERM sorting domain-containing protein [Pirellulales bacterium]